MIKEDAHLSISARGSDGFEKPTGSSRCGARWLALFCLLPGLALAQQADLVLNKEVDKSSARASEIITYTLRVTNNSPSSASTDIQLTDNLPGTTAFQNYTFTTGTGVCSQSGESTGGTVTCDLDELAPLAEAIVDVAVRVTASTPSTITNDASVSSTTTDPDLNNNSSQRNVTVTTGTDLEMVLAGDQDPVSSGGTLTYSASIINNGPDPALNPRAVIELAPGFVRSGSLPSGCNQSGQTVTCNMSATLASGNTWTIGQISGTVTVAGPSNLSTTATASFDDGAGFDGIPANNTAIVDTVVDEGTDVSVAMSRTGGSLVLLDEFQIRLSLRYSGGQPQDLELTSEINSAFEILGFANLNGWTCNVAGQDVTCTRADGGGPDGANNHDIGRVDIQVRAIASGSDLANTAQVSAVSPVDANLANNSATFNITVAEPSFDLQALKFGPPNNETLRVVDGQPFDFRLQVRNNSNVGFVGQLEMVDTLLAGLRVDNYTLNGWSCSPLAPVSGAVTISCTRIYTAGSPLAAGATTASVFLETVATDAVSFTNEMCVENTPEPGFVYPPDSNSGNDCASSGGAAQNDTDSADVRVIKTGDAEVVAGELLTYQLEIVNTGQADATTVTITDTFANLFTGDPNTNGFEGANISINAGSAVFDSCNNGAAVDVSSRNLSCTFSSLPVCTQGGNCPVITVQVRPLGAGNNGGDRARSNQACAYSQDTSDPDFKNNCDNSVTTVTGQADITVTKTAAWAEAPDPIAAGTNLTYTITVKNATTGASGADIVTMTDNFPLDVTFVSASASGTGSCATTPVVGATTTFADRTVECSWLSIQRNAQRTATIVVRPNQGTQGSTLGNTVETETTTPEVDESNNNAEVEVDVADPRVDLATRQLDSPDPLQLNDTVIYTLTVENFGPSVAEMVRLYNVLPTAGLSFQGFQYVDGDGNTQPGLPPGVTCSQVPIIGDFGKTVDRVNTDFFDSSSGDWLDGAWQPDLNEADIICDVADLMEQGDSVSFQMRLLAEARGVYTNFAIARSQEHRLGFDDIEPPNDTDPENTTVRTTADMEVISKVADPATVSLYEPFDYTVVVTNNGPGPALGVVVDDTFPVGMELTDGPTVVINSGTYPASTCTGVAGDTGFTCEFGDELAEVTVGAQATITVPVRLTSAASATVDNTATVDLTGLTFDNDSTNNDATGPVNVVVSSIAGRVYHDDDISGVYTPTNPPISGVSVAMEGTTEWGDVVSETTTTAVDGTYLFDTLPPGTYTVTQTQPAGWIDGPDNIGSVGGSNPTSNVFSNINLPADADGINYDFGEYRSGDGATASMTLSKTATPTGSMQAGEIISYTLTTTNTGDVALGDVTVTDNLISLSCTPAIPVDLGPGGTVTCTGNYTVTQSDIDDGGDIVNVGTAVAAPPSGPQLEETDSVSTPVVPAAPAIDLTKLITDGSPYLAVDDVIDYQITATNTGNVTLSGVEISDPQVTLGTCTPAQPTALAPAATLVCQASYTITQAEIDAGSFTNTAQAGGSDPDGQPVMASDSATANSTATPSLAIDKSQTSGPNPVTAAGEELGYEIVVENTGAVTLTDIEISDTLPDGSEGSLEGPTESISPDGVLEVSESWVWTISYTVTQDDLDAGADLVNSASVTTAEVPGPTTATETTAIEVNPALAIVKTGTFNDEDGDGFAQVGETISYAFEVTNTGNVVLTDVTVSDPLLTVDGGPLGSLAVGASDATTFTGTYTLTQADIDAGEVENQATATATGQDPTGTAVSDVSDDDSPLEDDPTVTPLGAPSDSPIPVPSRSWWMILVLLTTIAVMGKHRLILSGKSRR